MNKTISADYIYIIFIGDDIIIDNMINILNTDIKHIYIKHDILEPFCNILDSCMIRHILKINAINTINALKITIDETNIDMHKKYIIFDDGVETAQCLICAETNNNKKILMVLNDMNTHFKLSFPMLHLEKQEKADILINRWLKKYLLENIIRKLIIEPVNVVGGHNNILIFMAFIC